MPQQKPDHPFDSRRYQDQVERELIIGGIVITIVVGGGLIALIWGGQAFFTALVCFAAMLAIGAVIWLLLKLLEIVSRE